MSVSISIILDTRRMKQSKRYPIKLRVTFQRVTEYYQTVFDLTKNEWEKFSASRIGNELQTVKDRLKEIESHALDSIKKIEPFNFEDLKENLFIIIQISGNANRKVFLLCTTLRNSILNPFIKSFPFFYRQTASGVHLLFISDLHQKINSGRANYQCSYISLKKFRDDVSFNAITTSYLAEYENRLKSRNLSKTTI